MNLNDIQQLTERSGNFLYPNLPPLQKHKKVGVMDGQDVWEEIHQVKGHDIQTFFFYGDHISSYVSVDPSITKTGDQICYKFKELWTNEPDRRQGLSTQLLMFVTGKMLMPLWLSSDEIVSDSARHTIAKALYAHQIFAVDRNRNPIENKTVSEIFSIMGDTDDELFIKSNSLKLETFSDKKIDDYRSYHLIRGTELSLVLD
jgi:hypothetical protein